MTDLNELERLLREATALRARRNFALKEEQRALDPLYSKAEAELSEALRNSAEELIRDARRYGLLRRGQHWSVINGIGDTLRAETLDAAVDAIAQEQP